MGIVLIVKKSTGKVQILGYCVDIQEEYRYTCHDWV